MPLKSKTHVKICGITNNNDAAVAERFGADFIGIIVEIAGSHRSISPDAAEPILLSSGIPVVLLVEKPITEIMEMLSRIQPYGIQLIGTYHHRDITELKRSCGCRIWKTLHVQADADRQQTVDMLKSLVDGYEKAGVDAIVLDTKVKGKKGGTGVTFDWNIAQQLVGTSPVPVLVAGGINAHNALSAIQQIRPYGIDLSSGVEHEPGVKDPAKIAALMEKVRAAFAS